MALPPLDKTASKLILPPFAIDTPKNTDSCEGKKKGPPICEEGHDPFAKPAPFGAPGAASQL
jgi:hypothetical protein